MGNCRCMITRPRACPAGISEIRHLAAKRKVVALSKQDIEYIAHLARLDIEPAEIPDYEAKMSKIIEFIDELDQADTGDLVPMAHPLDMQQRLRPDEVTETNERDRYQQNAAETQDGLYVVPRVVE